MQGRNRWAGGAAGVLLGTALAGCSGLPPETPQRVDAVTAPAASATLGAAARQAPARQSAAKNPDALRAALGTPAAQQIAWPDRKQDRALLGSLQAPGGDGLRVTGARGPVAVSVYEKAGPSVVLVLNGDTMGSGSLVDQAGRIITNYHVVDGSDRVGVVFRPADPGAAPDEDEMIEAQVIAVDRGRDLALLQLPEMELPVPPVELGDMDGVKVGMDVFAIGHPRGEWWTFTQGIVSQVRNAYQWSPRNNADVIQTQTPINPGNSGGPLLDGAGRMVGVNSFGADGEGLNFAVTVNEVRNFLREPPSPVVQMMYGFVQCAIDGRQEGRSAADDADEVVFDVDCDGRTDGLLVLPDDTAQAVRVMIDIKDTGVYSLVIYDDDRDGRWDRSERDTNEDGRADFVGRHSSGELRPDSTRRVRQKKS
jgi:S1-C subfamily serine protease